VPLEQNKKNLVGNQKQPVSRIKQVCVSKSYEKIGRINSYFGEKGLWVAKSSQAKSVYENVNELSDDGLHELMRKSYTSKRRENVSHEAERGRS
jgi:hypothetical protein